MDGRAFCQSPNRRQLCLDRIAKIEGLEVEAPGGAFYMFARLTDEYWSKNDKEFVLSLLHEEHVLVVHGSGFSPEKGKGHIRIVYLADEDTLNTAFDRIDSFLSSHRLGRSHEVIPTGYSDEEVATRIFDLLGFHTVSECRDSRESSQLVNEPRNTFLSCILYSTNSLEVDDSFPTIGSASWFRDR